MRSSIIDIGDDLNWLSKMRIEFLRIVNPLKLDSWFPEKVAVARDVFDKCADHARRVNEVIGGETEPDMRLTFRGIPVELDESLTSGHVVFTHS